MSGRGPVQQVARAIAFGRHVPLARIARRIGLGVKRRVRQHTGAGAADSSVTPSLSDRPPLPVFQPRHGELGRNGGQLRFTFLNRSHDMTGAIDWRAGGEGPEHQLWRMNLHYMEYLEGIDDGLFADLAMQWIAANPPYKRGYWKDSWNSYTVSLRTVVWMQQLALRAERLDSATRAAILAALAQQVRFLEDNLETDIGGNHLIKNIKALIWASAFFAGSEAARWRGLGLAKLVDELPRQILPDGMHCERSPSYHCQVFADLLECRSALGEDPLGGALDEALARMAQVTADLAHPDGRAALFNDAGLSMAYAPAECLDVYAGLHGSKPAPRRVFSLRDAGYFGLRTGDTYFIADCGRIAPDDLPAHGHGDVLSFEWSVEGKRIIVDQGVYEYNAGHRRQASRSAASHNTLCFEDADQADFFGAFRCGRRPDVEVGAYEETAQGFVLEGTHDGFRHLPGAPRHIRRFEVAPERIVIRDRLEGRPDRRATIGFLLHPECRIEVTGTNARIVRGATQIQMTSTLPIRVEVAVWWPDMGCERATKRLRVSLEAGISELVTKLRIVPCSAGK